MLVYIPGHFCCISVVYKTTGRNKRLHNGQEGEELGGCEEVQGEGEKGEGGDGLD